MSNTESFFAKLQAFLDEHADVFESAEEAIDTFMKIYNQGIADGDSSFMESDETRAMDLHMEAYQTDTIEEYASLIDQAYQLDPTNLDIVKSYLLLENRETVVYEKLEELTEDYYRENKAGLKDSGYMDHTHRPYFRSKYALAEYYKDQYLFDKAEKHAKDILMLNENDNLGTRYLMMSIYILSYQHKKARRFYKSDDFYKDDDMMVFYMLVSAVLDGLDDYAYQLTESLLDLNPDIVELFEDFEFDDFYAFLGQQTNYIVGSIESLAQVVGDLSSIFIRSDYLYFKIREILKELAPEADFEDDPENILEELRLGEKVRELADQDIFDGMRIVYITPLIEAGLGTKEDFKEVTREEVLKIDGIGIKTVERLEKNGVTFKD